MKTSEGSYQEGATNNPSQASSFGRTVVFQPSFQPTPTPQASISLLPFRPQQAPLARSGTVNTNLYCVEVPSDTRLYSVEYSIFPIPNRNESAARKWIVESIDASIRAWTGTPVIQLGRRFYTTKKLPIERSRIVCTYNGQEFACTVEQHTSFPWRDVFSNIEELRQAPYRVANHLLKTFMQKMGYQPLESTTQYFDSGSIRQVQPGYFSYTAYRAEFVGYESLMCLRIDPVRRFFRERTVLDHIDDIYRLHAEECREQKRERICALVRNRLVVTSYGKKKVWKVQGVTFDCKVTEMSSFVGSLESLYDYYRNKYGVTINKLSQPLLLSTMGKQPVLLVPELLHFLDKGTPDNAQSVKERINSISQLTNQLQQSATDFNSSMSALGLKLDSNPCRIEFEYLPRPIISVSGQHVEDYKIAAFSMKDYRLLQQPKTLYIRVIYPKGSYFSYQRFLDISSAMGVCATFERQEIPIFNAKTVKHALKKAEAAFIILPLGQKSLYQIIKQQSLGMTPSVATQILMEDTIRSNKGNHLSVIIASALSQLLTKVGAVPWLVESDPFEFTMMVGLHKKSCPTPSKSAIVTLCANLDSKHSKYITRLEFEENQSRSTASMGTLLGQALAAYQSANGRPPSEIVLLRPTNCRTPCTSWTEQITQCMNSIEQLTPYGNIKLTYVCYDLEPRETFTSVDSDYRNARSGTLIQQAIASSVFYDFYLQSTSQTYDMSRSTYYKVVYSTSSWPENKLQQLIYNQSYNYKGRSGISRVPAVCSYARKLAHFASKLTPDSKPHLDVLSQQLFYL